MKSSFPLLSSLSKIVFFTKPNCGLCLNAKRDLHDVWEMSKKKFDYSEVDISTNENKEWFDKYQYDIPVIHITPGSSVSSSAATTASESRLGVCDELEEPLKMFHHIDKDKLLDLIDRKF